MTAMEPATEQMLDAPEATPIPWAEALSRLEHPEGEVTRWLATVRPDGRPHVVPIGAVWVDNAFYFTTGQNTQKEENLKHNAQCSISFANQGIDLVVEGTVARLTDAAMLKRLAALYTELGWPVTVKGDAFDAPFSAPSTGPAPYDVYEVTPALVFGFGTTEENAEHPTRWRFTD